MRPLPGNIPTRAWVSANTARSDAIRKSQPRASSRPPVNAGPLIGADDRLGDRGDLVDWVVSVQPAKIISAVPSRFLKVDTRAECRVGAGEHGCGH